MKKTLLFAGHLLVGSLILFAQTERLGETGQVSENSPSNSRAEAPAALKTIYSNLGSKTDSYNDQQGWTVAGPNSQAGTRFFALPFTPKINAHVSQVKVGIQYYGSGANQVNLSIYGDADGVPGTLLVGPVTVTNLPAAGTCCVLGIADFTPVAVTGGTKYWVVADTPSAGTGSDFYGAWEWVAKPVYLQGFNSGSGWSGANETPSEASGEVLGTIP